ncbi:MAG: hypothetical protein KDA28_17085, partial [Phycisphaerales bacterium]|nr:hypothetical protein [Phycisphaerales bacterium]
MGIRKAETERFWVVDAIEAILAGKPVPVTETESVGCVPGWDTEEPSDARYTFYRDVEPLVQRHCQECHRPGEVAPFSLLTYEDAEGWSGMIAEVVASRRMPPWHASPDFGHFANDRRLEDDEMSVLLGWIDDGCPAGDPHDRPAPRRFPTGWRIGEPALVLKMEKPFVVPAEGVIDYHHAILDHTFEEDTWVTAMEIHPGARPVVHHIMVFVIGGTDFDASDWFAEFDGGKHGYFALMVPGEEPTLYPEGMAKRIPAGSRLMMTLHYTPNGVEQADQSVIGLKLARGPVTHPAFTESAFNDVFVIEPGQKDVRIHSAYQFDRETVLVSLNPHMHYRGRRFVYKAHYPKSVKLESDFDVAKLPNHVRPRATFDRETHELGFLGWMSWTEAGILQSVAGCDADRAAIEKLKRVSHSAVLLEVP